MTDLPRSDIELIDISGKGHLPFPNQVRINGQEVLVDAATPVEVAPIEHRQAPIKVTLTFLATSLTIRNTFETEAK